MLKQKSWSMRVLLLMSIVFTAAGYSQAQRPGSAANGGRVTPDRVQPEKTKAGVAFAVYFTRRAFFEVDNDNVVSIKPASGDRVTGFGDTTIYVGADALH